MARMNERRSRTAKVTAPIALVLTLIGGAIAVRQFRRLSRCGGWYSGAWIELAIATGLAASGFVVATIGLDALRPTLLRPLFWTSSLSTVVVLCVWVLYSNEYAGCPPD